MIMNFVWPITLNSKLSPQTGYLGIATNFSDRAFIGSQGPSELAVGVSSTPHFGEKFIHSEWSRAAQDKRR